MTNYFDLKSLERPTKNLEIKTIRITIENVKQNLQKKKHKYIKKDFNRFIFRFNFKFLKIIVLWL